jgi:hypothetical protein
MAPVTSPINPAITEKTVGRPYPPLSSSKALAVRHTIQAPAEHNSHPHHGKADGLIIPPLRAENYTSSMQTIGIWGLREEARESWDHVISDKIIYLSEPVHGESEIPHEISKKYLQSEVWFEVHITCVKGNNREMHFDAILEMADIFFPPVTSGNSRRPARAADEAHGRRRDLLPQPGSKGGGIEAHGAADLE